MWGVGWGWWGEGVCYARRYYNAIAKEKMKPSTDLELGSERKLTQEPRTRSNPNHCHITSGCQGRAPNSCEERQRYVVRTPLSDSLISSLSTRVRHGNNSKGESSVFSPPREALAVTLNIRNVRLFNCSRRCGLPETIPFCVNPSTLGT